MSSTIWRTHMCGEPTKELVGEKLTLAGWVDRRRDHGGLVFVDLRDRTGITQLVINPEHAPEAAKLAHEIRNEFVLRAEGRSCRAATENVNPNMPTGEVELAGRESRHRQRSTPLPFQLDEENVDETLRLRYRWLDLRRERMQRNITLARPMVGSSAGRWRRPASSTSGRRASSKPTPEGARDFLVPEPAPDRPLLRAPQSPQLFKQPDMVAGFDRYYQIATACGTRICAPTGVQEITPARSRDGLPRARGRARRAGAM